MKTSIMCLYYLPKVDKPPPQRRVQEVSGFISLSLSGKRQITQCPQTHHDKLSSCVILQSNPSTWNNRVPKSKDGQRKKKRKAIKRCPHYLAHYHIAYTMNYDDLVSLM